MFLSQLMIDVGDNPDRPRPGRLWLRNIYHVHQRLSMAFPTPVQHNEDPNFLLPFDPNGFDHSRFLFRIDHGVQDQTQRAIIIVQSETKPDWEYAFHNFRQILLAVQTREYCPDFRAGDKLRFRILANPTQKDKSNISKETPDRLDSQGRPKIQYRRQPVALKDGQNINDALYDWFVRKGSQGGFTVSNCEVVNLGWVVGSKKNSGHNMRFRSVLLEGKLNVTDAAAFHSVMSVGIGSAKGFGFGLLSVVPLPTGEHP